MDDFHLRSAICGARHWSAGSVFHALCGVMIATLFGCGHVPDLELRLGDSVRVPEHKVVLFIVDGMAPGRVESLLAEGRLPNIRRRFVERGVRFSNAFGVFPSVTYANCSSIMTGCFPNAHGIPGNTWYDPQSAIFHDYESLATYLSVNAHLQTPTLFELVGQKPTLNLRYMMSRGADIDLAMGTRDKILWGLGFFESSDRKVVNRMQRALPSIHERGEWPALTVAYMPAVDEMGHRHGPRSEPYSEAIINADRIIGRFLDAYAEAGMEASTHYMLISDHSMVQIPESRRIDLARLFREEYGQRVWTGESLPEDETSRRTLLKQYDMILTTEAGRVARIYFPGEAADTRETRDTRRREWLERVSIQKLVENHPAIDLCMMPATNGAVMFSRGGHARIVRDPGDPPTYRVTEYEGDPLRYGRRSGLQYLLEGNAVGRAEVLRLTADTDYPDLVVQAPELFRSMRAGDLILTAAGDWSFHSSWNGAHGSALRDDMQITLYIAGPGIEAGTVEAPARSVDIVPTVLEWLSGDGAHRSVTLDGQSLAQFISVQ